MKRRTMASVLVVPLAMAGAVTTTTGATAATHETDTYRITLVNTTYGQPFSPPVAATHHKHFDPLLEQRRATPELASIAQSGDPSGAVAAYQAELGGQVTDVVNVGAPLTPAGVVGGPFPNTVSFDIEATAGDRLTLATMLICTNDGVTGLHGAKLPKSGSAVYPIGAYDAGVERNTEDSAHIPDACSALGPQVLPGDNNGNDDGPAVATDETFKKHKGIEGDASLASAHGWGKDPVGVVTVTKLS